ncbi:MAG: hypothetical protein J6I56_08975 [Lachnospiraceae bacterium]|nr:hypothetical protein [Lachnospiraceae bacterium]
MGKLGKFLIGCTIAGAAAAGAYYYLEKAAQLADSATDAPPGAQIGSFTDAAGRTYTTIKDNAEQAYTRIKGKMGPKGEGVLNVVEETAGRMKEVITDSAGKVKDIVSEETVADIAEEAPDTEPDQI